MLFKEKSLVPILNYSEGSGLIIVEGQWAATRRYLGQGKLSRRGRPGGRPATCDIHIDNGWDPSFGIGKGCAVRS